MSTPYGLPVEEIRRRLAILDCQIAKKKEEYLARKSTARWNSLRSAASYFRGALCASWDGFGLPPFRHGDRVQSVVQTKNKWPFDVADTLPEGEILTVKRVWYDEKATADTDDWLVEFFEIYCKARHPFTYPASAFALFS